MARNEKIQIDIEAKDEASPAITKLAKKIDGLESDEARIIVSADTRKLQDQLDRAQLKLQMLEGDEATVQSRLVGTLEEDLEQARKLMEQLEGQTATVKIDSVGAKQGIDDLGKSADSSKSVLANMVGNATQDLGALGGVAGSAGVAIGQMGEYMADARAQGEGFGSILKNFAPIGGVIGGISIAMAAFSDIMSKMAKGQAATKAFDTERVEQFTDAILEGKNAAQDYSDALEETGEVLVATGTKGGPAWAKILPGVREITSSLGFMGKFGKEIENIVPLLNKAGVSADVWTKIVTSAHPEESLDTYRSALAKTTLSQDEQHHLLIAARAEQDLYAESTANAAEMTKFWGEETANTNSIIDGLIPSIAELREHAKKLADMELKAAEKADVLAAGVAGITDAYDILSGRLDTSSSLVSLAQDFEDVRAKAFESTVEIQAGSINAQDALYDQALAQNALKQEIIDTSKKLGEIPPTVATEVFALIDQGSFTEAEELFKTLTRNRTMEISIVTKGAIGFPENRLNGIR
jgi:hypothetical protein